MSKLIKLIHPYEVESIKNISDFLVVLKNILRLSTNEVKEKKDGILIPVRWSYKKKDWVVDRGTDLYRDITGIDLQNIDTYFKKEEPIYKALLFTLTVLKSKELDSVLETFNLKKNETKFFAFEYCNNLTNIVDNYEEVLYPIGLFKRCETKKRKGLYSKKYSSIIIDNSKTILEKVANCSGDISFLNSYKIKNYNNVFNDFVNLIKEKKYCIQLLEKEVEVNPFEILLFDIDKSLKQKDVINFIQNSNSFGIDKFNKIKTNAIILLIYFDFVEFLKDYFNIKSKVIEGFVVIDNTNNIYYKLTGDFIIKVFNKNYSKQSKNLMPPLLPGVF